MTFPQTRYFGGISKRPRRCLGRSFPPFQGTGSFMAAVMYCWPYRASYSTSSRSCSSSRASSESAAVSTLVLGVPAPSTKYSYVLVRHTSCTFSSSAQYRLTGWPVSSRSCGPTAVMLLSRRVPARPWSSAASLAQIR